MATNHNDERSIHWPTWASNYGLDSVDIGAPGSYILSCVPVNDYESWSGTSMATPHVAGACALVWQMKPELSHIEVKDILLRTVDKTLPDLCVSGGRLNLYNAILEPLKNGQFLNKVDDVNNGNSVLPDDEITYSIYYTNPDTNDPNYIGTLSNVLIIDQLPIEVDYTNQFDPNYNSSSHTYTWNIGTMSPGDSNYVTLTVRVNNLANPLGKITNLCVLLANEIQPVIATEITDVNSWNPGIIYVDASAVGSKNGLSWYHAYSNFQSALQKTKACDVNQIWTAEGTYKPITASNRSISFELVDNVTIYSGFPSGGGAWTERNPYVYETVLSGDIGTLDYQYDNCYHVVKCQDVNNTVLDGFTITAGNANGSDANAYGGGIYCKDSNNLTLTSCNISQNIALYGGGIHSDASKLNLSCNIFSNNLAVSGGGAHIQNGSSSTIFNCLFSMNTTENGSGGGVYSSSSGSNVTNCIFTGNMAHKYGGGMHNHNYSSVAVANCIFNGNHADSYGGGISNDYSGVDLGNCTFSKNWADYGGGIYNINSNINITNCILWANEAISYDEIYYYPSYPTINYSDIKGGWLGGNENIDKDPCFFVVEQSGSWSANASYDNLTFQSTLTDDSASWTVNELAGRFVNPDTLNQNLQFFIVSNDVTTINVWGNVESFVTSGDPYQIYDYHLRVDSACIDAGDPNGDYSGQTDIDGEPRVFDGDYNDVPVVDMGADEYYWSPADINTDGFVNFFDYAFFASAWQSKSNDDNYNEDCDLEDNDSIDYNDIALFCEDWLWQAAWAKAFPCAYDEGLGRSMSMGMGEGFFPSMQAEQAQRQITAEDIDQILKWLTDLWLTDEDVRKTISEEEWLKFIEAVIQAAKEQTYN